MMFDTLPYWLVLSVLNVFGLVHRFAIELISDLQAVA